MILLGAELTVVLKEDVEEYVGEFISSIRVGGSSVREASRYAGIRQSKQTTSFCPITDKV